MKKGLIHIYCGDGKGKTTAAMGLAIRAAGREKKVFITQFLKSGKSGELVSLDKLKDYVTFLPGKPVNKFIWNMNDEEKKLETISFLVGYDDYNYFSRVFRKKMGESPREYRNNLHKSVKNVQQKIPNMS